MGLLKTLPVLCHRQRVFETDPTKSGPKRTTESYKNSVAQVALNQEIPSRIKFDSVCQPGLPPCLGHDRFEGVVSLDLAMYIKHLVAVGKHFIYGQLNRTISQFTYLGSDANNKPCEVKTDGEKLGGHAAQNCASYVSFLFGLETESKIHLMKRCGSCV